MGVPCGGSEKVSGGTAWCENKAAWRPFLKAQGTLVWQALGLPVSGRIPVPTALLSQWALSVFAE